MHSHSTLQKLPISKDCFISITKSLTNILIFLQIEKQLETFNTKKRLAWTNSRVIFEYIFFNISLLTEVITYVLKLKIKILAKEDIFFIIIDNLENWLEKEISTETEQFNVFQCVFIKMLKIIFDITLIHSYRPITNFKII